MMYVILIVSTMMLINFIGLAMNVNRLAGGSFKRFTILLFNTVGMGDRIKGNMSKTIGMTIAVVIVMTILPYWLKLMDLVVTD